MPAPEAVKYVCIHGHFYQPPRENPWIEELESEASAAPYHDWNERILYECYRSNMAARLVDPENHILRLHNNYSSLSFNFGPTLLRWMKKNAPWVYQAILDADRESCRRLGGHGNAFAQVYHHVIMPLANRRDKVTQVRWGIRDFEVRFGRRPEGMWLGETAVDRETLQVLAEEGIRFTVLSPFQAARWRFINPADDDPNPGPGTGKATARSIGEAAITGPGPWQDARGGTIPTGRAYRYDCGGGRYIHLFFYNNALAHGIAFERLLEHSSKLLGRIDSAFVHRPSNLSEPWLVHAATDGESYGHHFKFGDMALAAAFQELEDDPDTRIVNYGSFLSSLPVTAEADIVENSAWSCAHGLGRWQEDCGCNVGCDPGWNQKWRAPLREALNYLRDTLGLHYERAMEGMSRDPWEVRNDYIELLCNQEATAEKFLERHAARDLSTTDRVRCLQLLEMERCTLSMFTSCGWFFNEISELEAVLVMRHAARAIQLAEQTGAPSPEPDFLKILEKAPSNVPEFGNGANVYQRKVKPWVVHNDRVVANYVLSAYARYPQPRPRLFVYDIAPRSEEDLGSSPIPCRYGVVTTRDRRTLEEGDYLYALLHFGGLDFRCSVKPYTDSRELEMLNTLQHAVEEQNTVQMIRILDDTFGKAFFSLHDAFEDLRTSLALKISQEPMKIYTDFQRHMYQDYRPLMRSLKRWGIRLPSDMRTVVRRVLSDEANAVVKEILRHEQAPATSEPICEEPDFFHRAHMGRLRSIMNDARSWEVTLRLSPASEALGKSMSGILTELHHAFDLREAAKLLRLIDVCRYLDIKPELWKLQTLFYELVHKGAGDPGLAAELTTCNAAFVDGVDGFLECRFAGLLNLTAPTLQ